MMRLGSVLAIVIVLSGCQTVGGWFSSDKDVAQPAELVELSSSIPIERVWSTSVGKGINKSRPQLRPFHEGGRIWTADYRGRVTAVDAETGRVEHRFDTGLALSGGPTVQDGLVLLGTFDGELAVLDAGNGAVRWRARLSSEVLAAPVLHEGIVIVRCIDGRVFGLDRSDGARVWVYDRSVPLLTLRGNSPPLTRAGQVFIGYDDGTVSALRAADGTVLWEQRVSAGEGRTELERLADIDGPMMVVGTELYVVTYHGRLAGLALESGRMLWVKEIASATGLSLRRTQLAASDREDTLWMVDRRNGSTLWSDESLARRELTRPVFYGSMLVVADFEGYLHFYNSDDGELIGRTRASRDAPAEAPLVVGNMLYLLDEDGTLSAWRAGSAH